MALFVAGLIAMPGSFSLGLVLAAAGVWVSERSRLSRDDSGFIAVVMTLGGLGAAMAYAQFILEAIARRL